MPTTPVAGWTTLGYYDGGRDRHVGDSPCAVFGPSTPLGASTAIASIWRRVARARPSFRDARMGPAAIPEGDTAAEG